MKDTLLTAYLGLSQTTSFLQRKEGTLSYALNANIQTLDGERLSYTNELSNQLCVNFPEGFDVIGVKNILAKNEIIFAIVNTSTKESRFVKVKNYNCNALTTNNVESLCKCSTKLTSTVVSVPTCCELITITSSSCLKFDINFPVRMTYKLTNCGYRLYFSDDNNYDRFIDIDEPNGFDGCGKYNEELQCYDIKIFKEHCSPIVKLDEVTGGGNISAGVYLAAVAYCDRLGNELTDYTHFTNPTPIFERKLTIDTDYRTDKAIRYKITHNSDLYDYFKLVVLKKVNETSEYLEVGIYKVQPENSVIFNNVDDPVVRLDEFRINTVKPFYTKSKFIEESGNHLLLADLEGDPEYNLQPAVNNLILYWETVNMPYNKENNYSNPNVATLFRTYQRDEVYPFGIRFKLNNGKKTRVYHIPGRDKLPPAIGYPGDAQIVDTNRKDNIQDISNCKTKENKEYWEVYNTARKTITDLPSFESKDKICDITRGDRGIFAYWESTELYPCNEDLWGDLAGKPIRFHKFPDSEVSHHHDDQGNSLIVENKIKPIGVRIDENSINNILSSFFVYNPKTQVEDLLLKDLVCGFELVRGNRVGNKSVIAKGILYDVGKITEKDGDNVIRDYYFPNYPYNDTYDNDPYLSNNRKIYDTADIGYGPNNQKPDENGPWNQHSFEGLPKQRYTFHSPDTHFQAPQLGSYLKLEALLKGKQEGHFVQVQDHPRYKFLNKRAITVSLLVGGVSGVKLNTESESIASVPPAVSGKNSFEINYADIINTTNQVKDLIENLIPKKNFAYQYTSRGYYSGFSPVLNNEDGKIRSLEISKYLSPNVLNIGDNKPFNNYQRESSVFFKVNEEFRAYTVNEQEFSRFTLSSAKHYASKFSINNVSEWCSNPGNINSTDIRSYYASNKRFFPNQYGSLENVKWVTTGYEITLTGGLYTETFYPAFGGDTFINLFCFKRKMPFFTANMVSRPDEIAFDYDLFPNVGFPRYYMGTSSDELTAKEILDGVAIGTIIGLLTGSVIASLVPGVGGIAGVGTGLLAQTTASGILGAAYRQILISYLSKNNFDCSIDDKELFYQAGKFYLASYGIPQFFVESDINLELRHGRNEKEGNFVETDDVTIPEDWLQEKNVPIARDNTYNYNATYSLQNNFQFMEVFNNFDYKRICQSDFPNRIIYSEKANNEENSDNWLNFPISHYYDFDKALGKIVGIHGIDNEKLLIRFENGIQIWNTTITIQSNSPKEVQLQGSGIFGSPPTEFSKTDIGYQGSQHIAFEKTKVGMFYIDAQRGHVFRSTGNQSEEISKTEYSWFKENLPFNIIKDFPDYNIDNAFKDVGLIMCWDERFERLFITKRDYKLIASKKAEVLYNTLTKTFFRIDTTSGIPVITNVSLDDADYFENRSWTIAWSPLVNNWISFYSFLPNFYVSLKNHFQSGLRTLGLWNHGISNLSHQVFYNDLYPYILEYPITKVPQAKTMQSINILADVLEYVNENDYYSLKSVNKENYNIFFNKCIIYNKEQCSGLLELVEVPINNLREKMSYPKYNTTSVSILYSKTLKGYTFNHFFDITDNYNNGQPIFSTEWDSIKQEYPIDKSLNLKNANYRNSLKKNYIVSNEGYIRLIQDKHHRYKIINHLSII